VHPAADRVVGLEVEDQAVQPVLGQRPHDVAARHRTGETHWTFPTKATTAARALARHGLVRWKSGIVERTIIVMLTDKGRDLFVVPGYTPPVTPEDDALTLAARSGLEAIARRLGMRVQDFEDGTDG